MGRGAPGASGAESPHSSSSRGQHPLEAAPAIPCRGCCPGNPRRTDLAAHERARDGMALFGHFLQMAGKGEAATAALMEAVAVKPREKGPSMSAANSEADPVASLKEAHRAMWADGDYAAVARLMDEGAPAHMLSAVGVDAHHRVLDVATGTGNVALRAVRTGARVTGLDLTPGLLEIAALRAAALSAEVQWVQ